MDKVEMDRIEKELIKQLRKTSFIDKEMVKLAYQQDLVVEDEMVKAILRVGVDVDKERLQKWLDLCVKLEAIDESTQIDIAISKKFKELHDREQYLKRELEQYEHMWSHLKMWVYKIDLKHPLAVYPKVCALTDLCAIIGLSYKATFDLLLQNSSITKQKSIGSFIVTLMNSPITKRCFVIAFSPFGRRTSFLSKAKNLYHLRL